MNTWNGSGFLAKEPDIKYLNTKNGEPMAMASFSIACQRKGKDAGADFINCKAFGKTAEVIEKYIHRGSGIEIRGHIQTGSYEKDGRKIYTTDVIVDDLEFPKSRKNEESTPAEHSTYDVPQEEPQQTTQTVGQPQPQEDTGFMKIPDNIADNLPFR